MRRRPKKGVLRVYVPKGEWQLGPGKMIEFCSEPVPLPNRSCLVDFCGGLLIVRVDTVDVDGRASGEVVGEARRRKPGEKPHVLARDLIGWGLEALVREKHGL